MKRTKFYIQTILAWFFFLPILVFATDTTYFVVGNQGYDLVSYFTDNRAVKGNGDHFVTRSGINYLFVSDEHKKMFQANPEKYLSQFGGWCAFGVAVNRKVPGDPLVWKIVDGKLYLNLNEKVAKIWAKNMPVYIKKAEANWPKIKDKDPSQF